MTIEWKIEEAEADFILTTLNGQQTNWTVMARAQLIQKLSAQSSAKPLAPEESVVGGTSD